jgi:Tol biopolymer transport system component
MIYKFFYRMKTFPALLSVLLTANVILAQSSLQLDQAPLRAELLGNGVISTGMNERDFAISPDGKELYYTISTPQSTVQTIVWMKQNSPGKWSAPEVVPFAGMYSDLEPAFSTDGKRLYFSSNRPVTGSDPKDFDIWVVERSGAGWGEPKNLGTPVNTAADEFYPSAARNGNLYFTAAYPQGPGKEDIYVAAWTNNQFNKPVALDTGVNSKLYEFNAFVDPDEKFILFTSFGRKDDTGRGDLYISTRNSAGQWTTAKNLKLVNSSRLDYCPYVSPDKKTLFFTSERSQLPVRFEEAATYKKIKAVNEQPMNGTGNIYWISLEAVLANP